MSILMPEHRERAFDFGEEWERAPTGIYLPPAATPDCPTAMDLFAGAGGFSCGIHQAGFHVIAASEWWPCAVATYLCNLGSPATVVHVGKTAAPDATKKERKLFAEYGGQAVPAGVLFPVREEPVPAGTHVRADKHPETRVFGPGTGWIGRLRDHEPEECPAPTPEQARTPEARAEWCKTNHGAASPHRLPCEHLWMCDAYDLTGDGIIEALEIERGDLDLVVGGPPCQGFSTANANASKDDPRNLLVFEFARIVCELQPRAMMMENVPAITRMTTAEGLPVVDALSSILEAGGMGGYEALRKSLLATSGAGAAVRMKTPSALEGELDEDLAEQLALEGVAS